MENETLDFSDGEITTEAADEDNLLLSETEDYIADGNDNDMDCDDSIALERGSPIITHENVVENTSREIIVNSENQVLNVWKYFDRAELEACIAYVREKIGSPKNRFSIFFKNSSNHLSGEIIAAGTAKESLPATHKVENCKSPPEEESLSATDNDVQITSLIEDNSFSVDDNEMQVTSPTEDEEQTTTRIEAKGLTAAPTEEEVLITSSTEKETLESCGVDSNEKKISVSPAPRRIVLQSSLPSKDCSIDFFYKKPTNKRKKITAHEENIKDLRQILNSKSSSPIESFNSRELIHSNLDLRARLTSRKNDSLSGPFKTTLKRPPSVEYIHAYKRPATDCVRRIPDNISSGLATLIPYHPTKHTPSKNSTWYNPSYLDALAKKAYWAAEVNNRKYNINQSVGRYSEAARMPRLRGESPEKSYSGFRTKESNSAARNGSTTVKRDRAKAISKFSSPATSLRRGEQNRTLYRRSQSESLESIPDEVDSSANQRPLPAPAASTGPIFQPRKVLHNRVSALHYEQLGKGFINKFSTVLLQWNPTWIRTQRQSGQLAPVCPEYLDVRTGYENELDYYNTYVRLLLLDTWMKMCEMQGQTPAYDVDFMCNERQLDFVEVTCSAELLDWDVFPKEQDIVLCRFKTIGGHDEEMFGRVTYVKKEIQTLHTEKWKKVTFKIYFIELPNKPARNKMEVQILINIRIVSLQNQALYFLSDTLKHLVLDPTNCRNCIVIFSYHQAEEVKLMRNVVTSLDSPRVKVVLLDTSSLKDTKKLILEIAYEIRRKSSLALICTKDEILFERLALTLKPSKSVIAVKDDALSKFPEYVEDRILENRLRNGEKVREIYKHCPVTLTLLSAISLQRCSNEFLKRSTVCIVDDAHLFSEVETALLLKYNIGKLVLLGKPACRAHVPEYLKKYGYEVSLFMRLYQAK